MLKSGKMKKVLIAALLALLVICACVFTLTACGGKDGGQDKEQNKEQNGGKDEEQNKNTEPTITVALMTTLPKTQYEEGETFSVDGMEWSVVYDDLSTGSVKFTSETKGVTVNPSRALTPEDNKVEVTYCGFTMPIPVVVAKAEPAILMATVTTFPKTQYEEGETFSMDGMVWSVAYDDLSTGTVSFTDETEDVTFTPSGALKTSDTSVEITYKGYTLLTPIPITVKPEAPITDYYILDFPDKTEYFEGEQFEIDGLEVNFTYGDGSRKTVTFTSETEGVSVSPAKFNSNPNGDPDYVYPNKVQVTYKGFKFNVPVSVKYPEVSELRIKTNPKKTTYFEGESFDPSGLVITVVWEDGDTMSYPATSAHFSIPTTPLTLNSDSVRIKYVNNYTIYGNIYVDVPVEVIYVTDVEIDTPPATTEYVAGQTFDPSGMKINVTYSNGDTVKVALAKDTEGLTLPDRAIAFSDSSVRIYYRNKPITVKIEILRGVYIEAENAAIDSSTFKTPSEAVDKDGKPNASGGKYVSDLNAGDSITFSFYSDKAGKGDLAFILASKYLKADKDWSPVKMGDCQFNLICKFLVNGEEYDIPDSVILPGGEAETSAGAAWLWYNWKEVTFGNVDFVQGVNEVVLEFIPHNINDCSQSSFNGTFTANVDSLKVTSEECEIEPRYYAYEFQNAEVCRSDDDGIILVLSGTVDYVHYTEGEVAQALERYLKIGLKAYDTIFDLAVSFAQVDGEYFTVAAILSDIRYEFTYVVTVGGENLEADAEYINDDDYYEHFMYYIFKSNYYGDEVRLTVERCDTFHIYGIDGVTIEEGENGEALYCLTGEFYASGYSEEEIKTELAWLYFGLQFNPEAAGYGNSWEEFVFTAVEVEIIGYDTFKIKYDISKLEDYCYTTHFMMGLNWQYEWKPSDVKLDYSKNSTTTIGNKQYTVISVPGSAAGYNYWGCVGLEIETL